MSDWVIRSSGWPRAARVHARPLNCAPLWSQVLETLRERHSSKSVLERLSKLSANELQSVQVKRPRMSTCVRLLSNVAASLASFYTHRPIAMERVEQHIPTYCLYVCTFARVLTD